MRKISLKREGKEKSVLDLYDLLLHGNSANNDKLESGDVVFVPVVGSQVSISGEVPHTSDLRIVKECKVSRFH